MSYLGQVLGNFYRRKEVICLVALQCVHVCVCVRACMCVCVCACVTMFILNSSTLLTDWSHPNIYAVSSRQMCSVTNSTQNKLTGDCISGLCGLIHSNCICVQLSLFYCETSTRTSDTELHQTAPQ